jgi:DNA-binding CsgD family transcriptional regulator/tetratricopeptide (TPR) repeat protein
VSTGTADGTLIAVPAPVAAFVAATADDGGMTVPAPDRAIFGRAAELDSLGSVLGIGGERSGAVLLAGDAGVGKTRVLIELAARARTAGWQVLVGHCLDSGDSALPYLPFSEVFGQLATRSPGLVDALVTEQPAIARLLPARRLLQSQPAPADRVDRAEVVEAVHAALGRLGAAQPVLLVLEDAHWADHSTRDLITLLLTRGFTTPVSIAVSYRSDDLNRRHPLRSAVAEWGRLPGVTRVALAPLPDAAVRELVHSLHPDTIPERRVSGIVARSEGNAFFAEELVAASTMTRVPGDLADLLLVRLERLGDPARRVVRAAAVAGRRVSHELLARVAGLERSALDDAVREAVEALVLVPANPDGYAFRHALMAEAVYDDLLPGERTRLHASYVRVLLAGEVAGTAAELARHARAAHDLTTAREASIRAGDEAMAVGGPDEAIHNYEVALTLLADTGGDWPLLVDLTERATYAAAAAGQQLRALALVHDAMAQLPDEAPPEARVQLLVTLASLSFLADTDIDPYALTSEALELLSDPSATALRAWLLEVHARANAVRMRYDEAARWAAQSLQIAEQLGLADVAGQARTTLANVDQRTGDPVAALHNLEKNLGDARASGDPAIELRALYTLGGMHFELGRLADARATFESAYELAVVSGRPWAPYAVDSRMMVAQVAYVAGDWDDVAGILDVSGQSPPALSEAMLAATGTLVPAGRGDQSALETVATLRHWSRRDGLVAIMTGSAEIELALARDELAAAQAAYHQVGDTVSRVWSGRMYLAQIRLAALVLGGLVRAASRASAAERTGLLDSGSQLAADAESTAATRTSRGLTLGPEGQAWQGRVEAELARLHWTAAGSASGAELVEAWERNVEQFERFGHVYEVARSRARLAAVLRAVGRSPESAAQVRLARAVAVRLRAEPLLGELRTLGGAAAAHSGPAGPDEPARLTPREQEVLTLLGQGRTNGQIATLLFISVKTVSVHVSNILAKLQAEGRTEAVAIARRRGLLADG